MPLFHDHRNFEFDALNDVAGDSFDDPHGIRIASVHVACPFCARASCESPAWSTRRTLDVQHRTATFIRCCNCLSSFGV